MGSDFFQKCLQPETSAGMAEFAQSLGFNLADALARYLEVLAYLLQSVLAAIVEPEPHPDDLLFTRRKALQNLSRLLIEIQIHHVLGGRDMCLIDDEVSQVGLILFSDRSFERNRFLCDAHHAANAMDRKFHALSEFLVGWLTAQFLNHGAGRPDQLVDRLDHVNRD